MPAIPGGRFAVVGSASVNPGHCLICRGVEGPFIDTNTGDDFLGVFYLCKNCISEMAINLDVVVDENVLAVHNAYVKGMTDAIGKVKERIDGELLTALNSLTDLSVLPPSDLGLEGITEDSDGEGEDSPEADGSDVESDSASSGEGPDRLSSHSGHGAGLFDVLRD